MDTQPEGNSASHAGTVQSCISAAKGSKINVDILIEDIHDLASFEMTLTYDSSRLKVVDADVNQILASLLESQIVNLSDALPSTSGLYRIAARDEALTGSDHSGVLARITFEALDSGIADIAVSSVSLRDTKGAALGDINGDGLYDGTINNATLAIDKICPVDVHNSIILTNTLITEADFQLFFPNAPIMSATSPFVAGERAQVQSAVYAGTGIAEGLFAYVYQVDCTGPFTVSNPDLIFPLSGAPILPFNFPSGTSPQETSFRFLSNFGGNLNFFAPAFGTSLGDDVFATVITDDRKFFANVDDGGVFFATPLFGFISSSPPQKITGRFISSALGTDITVVAPTTPLTLPSPFLDLPWDYEGKGLSFNEAALSINSFFDHEYPLLGFYNTDKQCPPAPIETPRLTTTFRGDRLAEPESFYHCHDGYDYGKKAKANLGDPVLAAANGCASYVYTSAGGNVIKIDHGNYYQTRYLHLQDTGLITEEKTSCVEVTKGQQIGLVGSTGNSTGAHIHFAVYEDKNKDGNFEDNIPDGVTDPFGWQSKEQDPWPLFVFDYAGQSRTGNRSYYLWNKKLDSLDATLTSNGGVFNTGRYTVEFPEDATDKDLNLNIQSAPILQILGNLVSIGTTLDISAYDLLGNLITSFQEFFDITVDFSSFDLIRYDLETLSIYSSTDGVTWTKEPTIVDLLNFTATTTVDHLTHFALLAERKDTIAPTTTATLDGLQGQPSWYRGDVTLTLTAEDNENGLGVDYTLYKIQTQENSTDWTEYSSPLIFTTEGHHKIEFYSVDKDENIEEINSIEFDIDKTPPDVSIDANPKEIWPPNGKMVDVAITGFAKDNYLFSKTFTVRDEYDLIEPTISDFGATIQLEAKRNGSDKDGRRYIIKAVAEDLAGNIAENQTQVIVPHDQGKKKK